MRRACLAALVLLLALPSAARAERFRYRYTPGQVVQNRAGLAGAMMMGQPGEDMAKMQFRVSLKSVQRVLSASGGVVTLEITDTPVSGSTTAFGQTQPHDKTPSKSIVKITERGRFLSRKDLTPGEGGAPSPAGMDAADVLYGLNFPDRDLQPGDAWEETLTVGPPEEPQKVHVSSKYVARETVKGRECAKFQTTLTTLAPEAPASDEEGASVGKLGGTFTTYFDPKAGVEVYSSGSLTILSKTNLGEGGLVSGALVSVTRINVVQSLVPGR